MLELVAEARAAGLSQTQSAAVLGVVPRTLQRWRRRGKPVAPSAPAPVAAGGAVQPPPQPTGDAAPAAESAERVADRAPAPVAAGGAVQPPAQPTGDAAPAAESAERVADAAPAPEAPATPAARPGSSRARPFNALRFSEAALVVALIRSRAHADQSCRDLSLSLLTGPAHLYVSPVTFWAYQCLLNCNGPRGRQTTQGRRTAPDTDWVTGPNQLWDWDVSFLATPVRGAFLYLYSLLDHFSRKNLAWQVSQEFTSAEAQRLWDQALLREGMLDRPQDAWPTSLSDRGAQMRAHSTARYFHKLGIAQLFSRPHRPNDNPYIESHFATVKTHPVYPGYFTDQPHAEGYFGDFYPWYNDVHPHTRLAMLTPSQVHAGLGPQILAERAALKAATFAARRAQTPHTAHDVRPFTLEELIANTDHLPDVSDYPCYSWAGPTAPAN